MSWWGTIDVRVCDAFPGCTVSFLLVDKPRIFDIAVNDALETGVGFAYESTVMKMTNPGEARERAVDDSTFCSA